MTTLIPSLVMYTTDTDEEIKDLFADEDLTEQIGQYHTGLREFAFSEPVPKGTRFVLVTVAVNTH